MPKKNLYKKARKTYMDYLEDRSDTTLFERHETTRDTMFKSLGKQKGMRDIAPTFEPKFFGKKKKGRR